MKGEQRQLIAIGTSRRRPSRTAALTRAHRAKARAWIAAQGLRTWKGEDWMACCNHSGDLSARRRHAMEGAFLPSGNDAPHHEHKVCLDCCPYPGTPMRNQEHWCTNAERDAPRARCLRSMEDRGGVHSRGGPFCWECGSPQSVAYDAWLLALRDNPGAPRPWYGDKAEAPGGDDARGEVVERLNHAKREVVALRSSLVDGQNEPGYAATGAALEALGRLWAVLP